jgi:ribosomal protein S18 acetylase RimI-like enzyme
VIEVVLRPPLEEDAEGIAEALNAHSRSLFGADAVTPGEIRNWFETPDLDPARDMRVAVLPDGAVAGYADVAGGYGEPMRLWVDLRVRPGYDAVGPPLFELMEQRARERSGGSCVLRAQAQDGDPVTPAVFREAGLRTVRSSYRMEIDLARTRPADPVWPGSLRPVTFDASRGDERVHAAQQAGFADHWEFHPTPIEEWRHSLLRPPHDPSLWFLVEDGDEIAALCLCRPHETGDASLGWVSELAVLPPWRRRGLARALLLHSFAAFRARGLTRVGLGVDAASTTGAVALYESVGMRVVRRNDTYEKVLA